MRKSGFTILAAVTALSACNQTTSEPSETTVTNEAPVPPAAPDAPSLPEANDNQPSASAPATPPSLPEPKGPIDPKSAEGAGQIVQQYGALIEQGRFNEASRLWGNRAAADAFAARLKSYKEVHLEIGDLGEPEGAAGSIYLSEPVTFYGKNANGRDFRRKAIIVLRRVNDVPGSTAEQRLWHIERIDQS